MTHCASAARWRELNAAGDWLAAERQLRLLTLSLPLLLHNKKQVGKHTEQQPMQQPPPQAHACQHNNQCAVLAVRSAMSSYTLLLHVAAMHVVV